MNMLERDKDFKEEQFDYVQQTLRTIALKCLPVSLHILSCSDLVSYRWRRALLHIAFPTNLFRKITSLHPPSTLLSSSHFLPPSQYPHHRSIHHRSVAKFQRANNFDFDV